MHLLLKARDKEYFSTKCGLFDKFCRRLYVKSLPHTQLFLTLYSADVILLHQACTARIIYAYSIAKLHREYSTAGVFLSGGDW